MFLQNCKIDQLDLVEKLPQPSMEEFISQGYVFSSSSPSASLPLSQIRGASPTPDGQGIISTIGAYTIPPTPQKHIPKKSLNWANDFGCIGTEPAPTVTAQGSAAGIANLHLDFSSKIDPKNGNRSYMFDLRDATRSTAAAALGIDVRSLKGMGLDRRHSYQMVEKFLSYLSKDVDFDKQDKVLVAKARKKRQVPPAPGTAKKMFYECFYRGYGSGAIYENGVKFQKFGCGRPECPFCAQHAKRKIAKKTFAEIFAIATAARIPSLGTWEFTLPSGLSQKWAFSSSRIKQLGKIISSLLRKAYGFRTQDTLSMAIHSHHIGGGDLMTDRLHFHADVLPIAICTNQKGKDKGLVYAKVADVDEFYGSYLDNIKEEWTNEVRKICNENELAEFSENKLNTHYNFIPLIEYNAADPYEFIEKEKNHRKYKPRPDGLLNRFTYVSRSTLQDFTEKPLYWDETGVLVPVNGWTGATGITWEDYVYRAKFLENNRHRVMSFGLFKSRKRHLRSLGVGFLDNEDPVAEVKTFFNRKFGKKVVKCHNGETETLRHVSKWTAKFLDETEEEFINPNFADILKSKIVVDYEAWRLNIDCDRKEDEYSGEAYLYYVKHFTPSGAFRTLEYAAKGKTLDRAGNASDKLRYEYYKKISDDKRNAEALRVQEIDQHEKSVREKNVYDASYIGNFYNTFFFKPNLRRDGSLIFPKTLCVNHEKIGEWLNENGKHLKKEISKREQSKANRTPVMGNLSQLSLVCDTQDYGCFEANDIMQAEILHGANSKNICVKTRQINIFKEDTYYNEHGDIIGVTFCDEDALAKSMFEASEEAMKEAQAIQDRISEIQRWKKTNKNVYPTEHQIYPEYPNDPF